MKKAAEEAARIKAEEDERKRKEEEEAKAKAAKGGKKPVKGVEEVPVEKPVESEEQKKEREI